MRKKKEILASLLIFALVLGGYLSFFSFTLQAELRSAEPTSADIPELLDMQPRSSQFVNRTIRVAIYNEPNVTDPAYVSPGHLFNNDFAAVESLLQGAGYEVSNLTIRDISAHNLTTANYDVFLMLDNVPRENITNHVKEFWLGGGGILTGDSAISYLCYFGILPPESEGTDSMSTYYNYFGNSDIKINITTRHPVTKSLQINETFEVEVLKNWAAYNWSALQSTSIAQDIVRLGRTKDYYGDYTPFLGFDPKNRGGRVVHMPLIGGAIGTNMSDLIIDAVDWLCPRPKGRIVYDLSHNPRLGVDDWDTLSAYPGYYEKWRDNLVSRSYTFDKLYPSSEGNFTKARLEKYDMLIILSPDSNFSTTERNVVTNWINSSGGQLLILSENSLNSFFIDPNTRINFLLESFDLEMNMTTGSSVTVNADLTEHPTTEGCTNIIVQSYGYINITGTAYPIWKTGANIIVAGQEYGSGRIILCSDMNFLTDTQIDSGDNLQFGINVVNWLTACDAEVLIYVDDFPGVKDPNDNYYRGPVAKALNDLGLSFYLTFTDTYFDLSLDEKSWKLVIIDNNYSPILAYASDIINYVKNGGKLIIRSYQQRFNSPLWEFLGYSFNGTYYHPTQPQDGPPKVYIWNSNHSIFQQPAKYNADNISSTWNCYSTDFVVVKLYDNAIGIAGLTKNPHINGSAIILSANGRVISNTMALSAYCNDTDNSTYPDALEIWENEIYYLMYLSDGALIPPTAGDDDDDDDDEEFPWLLIIIIMIAGAAGIVALIAIIVVIRRKK